jgi:NitT/TauT family transport system substrate-binding protein
MQATSTKARHTLQVGGSDTASLEARPASWNHRPVDDLSVSFLGAGWDGQLRMNSPECSVEALRQESVDWEGWAMIISSNFPCRQTILAGLAVAAVGLTVSAVAPNGSQAQDLKEVNFSEAVHNLGYINLYVGMHAGIFEKHGLKMNVSAAGGDTQTFAAVLGGSADFAIGDATMVQMSREAGGPGVVVGTVIQRAHYFGVSKTLEPITDPKAFKGLTIVTSPEPNTNFSVAKRMLETAGLKVGEDTTILQVNPGTEIGAMLAGQADMAIAYQPSVAAAVDQGAKVVFDFSNYVGPFMNTGIMVLPSTIERDPEMVQALVTAFEEASRLTYSDPDFAKEVARKEFPDLPPEVADAAIDAELEYKIPAETVVVQEDQWKNLMAMQVYLGNVKGDIAFAQVVDNSFALKAVEEVDKMQK